MTDTFEDLLRQAHSGRTAALGRLISLIERGQLDASTVHQCARSAAPGAHVIGFTGAPGVGKSTALDHLTSLWRSQDRRVAILAVDPSSNITGGAVLGDRARMGAHSLDGHVFIRSIATRGRLGGLSDAVPLAAEVLALAGFDIVAVETVGVGQSETDVAGVVDTTCVLLAPGMGDGLQAVKAGIMEIGDVFVVTKSDLLGAPDVARVVRSAVGGRKDEWRAPVVMTSSKDGAGFDTASAALDEHRAFGLAHGIRRAKAAARARHALITAAFDVLHGELEARYVTVVDDLVEAVAQGAVPTAQAAEALLSHWRGH